MIYPVTSDHFINFYQLFIFAIHHHSVFKPFVVKFLKQGYRSNQDETNWVIELSTPQRDFD